MTAACGCRNRATPRRNLRARQIKPAEVAEDERDYFLERKYPSFGNLAPRDISSRAAKEACDDGRGVAPSGHGVYLDFKDAIARLSEEKIRERYGNLFDMYERITGDSAYRAPMMIYPAVHYTMGGLWVDYNLMSNLPGLFVLGEANFSDHGANRLGASALMQGLADGYFVLPYTLGDYLARTGAGAPPTDHEAFQSARAGVAAQVKKLLSIQGDESARSFHLRLGKIMWEYCGMARSAAGLQKALQLIPELRAEFWQRVRVPGSGDNLNMELERAGRVADFWNLASCCAATPSTATNPAAATSASSIRTPRAKRCATTSISSTPRSGSLPARANPRSSTRSRWCMKRCTWRRGRINERSVRLPDCSIVKNRHERKALSAT